MPPRAKKQGLLGRLKRLLKRGRYPVMFGVALVLFLFSGTRWFLKNETVQLMEGRLHDLRFILRGNQAPSPEVTIVGINPSSLDANLLGQYVSESEAIRLMSENTWPWPRTIHAKVVERLFECGARVVAVDIGFPSDREGDEALAEVLRKYPGRVVLASLLQTPEDQAGRLNVTILPPNNRFMEAAGPNASGLAFFRPDLDATARRFDYRTSEFREHFLRNPEGIDDDSKNLVHFAVRAVELFTGKPEREDYAEIINFGGRPSNYAYLPVEEVFVDRLVKGGGRVFQDGQALKDKLVFYGPIAEIFHDSQRTPFGTMPGVEIHANVAASLLAGKRIIDASPWAAGGMAFVIAMGSAAIVLLLRNPLWQALAMGTLLAGMFLAAQLAFSIGGIMVPLMPWLVCSVGTGTFGILYLFLLEQWDKAHTRKVLERSVNKRIAKVVLQNAEEFDRARKGERRSVAILFSDIRGFTTWSESAEPENLVGQLNEYFERMVDLIEGEESMGNAQKFIGDAILAAWGDTPENQFGEAEDARRAVSVALKMRIALKELNITWDARADRSVINIGIGINIGSVVVGEVGHPERGEYTVLGDGVNFAARLESATKQFHTDCLVGENVEALTRGKFVYRHADYIRVKGKTKPVNVFFLISEITTPPPEWLDDFHRARSLYMDRKFFEAAELFGSVKARIGGEDYLCELYLKLCTQFIQAPPPSDWDGSRELTEK